MKVMMGLWILILLCLPIIDLMAQFSNGEVAKIAVEEIGLRQRASNLSRVLATLSYEDEVVVQSTRSGWVEVRVSTSGQVGWVSESALFKPSGEFISAFGSSSSSTSGASGDEVSLAGKGFNSEVEAEYVARENLDLTWVDEMEDYEVVLDDLLDFIDEGGLSTGGAQ
jgi:hypothetical protein